jgi:CTP synthase
MTKYIFVIGGVISGVGKGVAAASIGKILQNYGYDVTAVKIDPYINCDAGTLRPTEHGEVWVTEDGGETDQDLGNYERFLGINIPKRNNITTGQIYKEIIEKERSGKFLGQTVSFIPHVIEEIKSRIVESSKDHEISLVEIGGTVGDYENIPFLLAAKKLERELGKDSVAYILVSYLPVPLNIKEAKTKPTQHSIRMLYEHGIFPDFILCRAIEPLDEVRKGKIASYINLDKDNIISAPDVLHLYQIPINLEK